MGTDAAKTQQTIDFGQRGQRLRLLDRVRFPEDIKQTSPAAMLSVLRCLESHSRDNKQCRVTIALVASEVHLSRRSVERAMLALQGLFVVSKKRTGRSSFYEICWGNLAEFDPLETSHQEPAMRHHDASDATSCRIRCDTVTYQMRHGDASTEAPLEAQLETPPQPPSDDWQEAAEAVAKYSFAWKTAISHAKEAGVSPRYVLDCVAYFQAAGNAFKPGALFERLRNAADFHPPTEPHTWPKPDPLPPREKRAAELFERVKDWVDREGLGDEDVRRSFTNAAFADGFTPAEVDRVLFEFQLHPIQGTTTT